jgi:RimJ/RimL family protein N-acetyltransferase
MAMNDIEHHEVIESLRDRRPVTIRAIRPDDKGLVVEALKQVGAESLYRRLFTAKKEFTAGDLKNITEVDFVNVVALVAVLKEDGNDQIAGGGRYIRTGPPGTGQKAEVAFLVGDAFQGLGIASRLFTHLVTIARRAGITRFEADVLPSNEAMLKVFARGGFPITRTATHDSVHVSIELSTEEKS